MNISEMPPDLHQLPATQLFPLFFTAPLLEQCSEIMENEKLYRDLWRRADRINDNMVDPITATVQFAKAIARRLPGHELFTQQAKRILPYKWEGLKPNSKRQRRIDGELSSFTEREQIQALASKLAVWLAVETQQRYEAPNPITGVSQADLDCCHLGFLDE